MDDRAFLTALISEAPPPRGISCLAVRSADSRDFAEVQADCARLVAREPYSVPTRPDHPTAWTRPTGDIRQYSLLTATGRCDDSSRDHDHSCFGKRFWPNEDYPALARLLGAIPHCVNARINWLGPGARLEPHRESIVYRSATGVIALKVRFHLPVRTVPEAGLMVTGDWFHLDPATLYVVNNGRVHSALNDGADPRWHLVFDCLLTREVHRALISPEGPAVGPFRTIPPMIPTVIRHERVSGALTMPDHVRASERALVQFAPVQ